MWLLFQLLLKACLPPSTDLSADWSTAVTSHAAVNSDARIAFRSLLKIFEYAAKQAMKAAAVQ